MKPSLVFFTLFFCCLFHSLTAQVPTNNLIAYWPFNGNANDESSNSNNGTWAVLSGGNQMMLDFEVAIPFEEFNDDDWDVISVTDTEVIKVFESKLETISPPNSISAEILPCTTNAVPTGIHASPVP